MQAFTGELVAGRKRPYDTWTFLVLPDAVVAALGRPPFAVRGTLAGAPFRGRAARGEGVVRVPVTAAFCEGAGVRRGDRVEVRIDVDRKPPGPVVPAELQARLDADATLRAAWDAMAPSHRRAWAQHVGEAARPETRARRAAKADEGIRARAFPR